jgi:hypothetical protein
MKTRFWLAVAVLTATGLFAQPKVSLTVYNKDMATVRDMRTIEFKQGVSEVQISDIAARIDPTSVQFSAPGVSLLEQNFNYDLVSTEKLLRKFIGREVDLTSETGLTVHGKVLSVLGQSNRYDSGPQLVILQEADGSIRSIQTRTFAQIHYPSLPEGTFTRPSLNWKVQTDAAGDRPVEISYLTHGINWRADYALIIADSTKRARLEAWVTIDNKTGATYNDATLKLLAGDVHKAADTRAELAMKYEAPGGAEPDQPFESKSFFEYHLYTLDRPATLLDQQTKQISLFVPADIAAKRIYVYNPQRNDKRVGVSLEVANTKTNGLGIPLPEGLIRVFQNDTDQAREYLGDDRIGHTAINEKIRVIVGEAFDIAVERVKKNQIGRTTSVWEVRLRNHKQDPVHVLVTDHFGGDWHIQASSHDMEKVNASTLECPVLCLPEEEVLITYTIYSQL